MSLDQDPKAYPLAEFRKTYFEECAELLDALQSHLDVLANGGGDNETLHAIFRAVHSIKGGAGAFGFNALVSFSHVFESLLDAMRDGKVSATFEVVQLLLRASDALSDIVTAARQEQALAADFGADLVAAMEEALHGAASPAPAASQQAVTVAAADDEGVRRSWRIRFAPHSEMLQKANEPLLLVRQLRRLGDVSIEADSSRIPSLEGIEPEAAYLSWAFSLHTDAAEDVIREVFEFVEDECDLRIECLTRVAVAPPGVNGSKAAAVAAKVAEAASATSAASSAAPHSIRVDVDKIDRLVNLVGELVITQAMLIEQSGALPADQYPSLVQGVEALARSTRELQESVMSIRAQPVKSVFARMPRIVRELAATLGKEVRIVTSGETTEIDKTVIEQLNDPLTHMIRNALDHGIELPDERAAAGKPRQGTIQLSAAQRSGRIVIEVSDDGRGINRERVLAKARDRGLVPHGTTLSDEEIDNLIFLPAFSTAESVSNISGRGVGMDVVKRNVQTLGGRINVQSRFGTGSRFTMSLPLTLAVLDGMVVSVGAETFIVPLTSIIESLRPRRGEIHPIVERGDVLALRGEYVPLIHLHRCFSIDGAIDDPRRGIVIIVQSESAGRIGIVVDELLGQQQVVVKSLEANYEPVDGVSGATILGNGRVALILDVGNLREIDRRGPDARKTRSFRDQPPAQTKFGEQASNAA
jgi:two-component system chemotaxis sensor kinase CheA